MKEREKQLFQMPFIGIDRLRNDDMLYHQRGDYSTYILRLITMDFKSPKILLDNLLLGENHLEIWSKATKNIPLIDTGLVDLPDHVVNYDEKEENGSMEGMPSDKIDLADVPMQTNRISNRNTFVLGPSSSGKSFFINALIEQYCMYNKSDEPRWEMDVVNIDVGHSYSGLCAYMNGSYITYSEDDPITTNPFAITREEFNVEKKDGLQSLVCLLWKSTLGSVSQVEADVITSTITAYYNSYFKQDGKVKKLGFNSFYEYALEKIPQIKEQEKIPFNVEEFRFVLKKFYKNGEMAGLLNKEMDHSLLTEQMCCPILPIPTKVIGD